MASADAQPDAGKKVLILKTFFLGVTWWFSVLKHLAKSKFVLENSYMNIRWRLFRPTPKITNVCWSYLKI